jgi:hypothetical protein
MHHHRTAAVARRTVSGLGVCDALRLEVDPVQLPWLAEELDDMRGPLEEALLRARADGAADEAAAHEHALRLLGMLRAQIAGERQISIVGPTGMVDEVVRGAVRNVVGALADLIGQRDDVADGERLQETATAAEAWVRTFVDLRAVLAFEFDPQAERPCRRVSR